MSEGYDLLIIGGGISGLGAAWQAAEAGMKVLLLEKGKCCRAASASSLRVIHGGIRYLQTFDLPRTLASIAAQAELLEMAPELVKPLDCLMPLRRLGLKSRWPVAGAITFYNLLAGWQAPALGRRGRVVRREFVEEAVPLLKGLAPYGALLWRDALLADAHRFAAWVKDKGEAAGARIWEDAPALEIELQAERARVRFRRGGCAEEAEAAVVANCAGAWLRRVAVSPAPLFESAPRGWCKSFNLILKRQLEPEYAVGISAGGGRLYFTAPRGDVSVVGTFDSAYDGDPDQAVVTAREIDAALDEFNAALPSAVLSRADVESAEAGILPMKSERGGRPRLYGAERIFAYGRYIEVLSTKYTTFLGQARRVVPEARRRMRPAS